MAYNWTVDEWKTVARRGTDGSQVWDLIGDYEQSEIRVAKLVEHITVLRENLCIAAALAGIASDWDLGTDGEIEIDDEWVSCWSLKQRFESAINAIKEIE